MRDPRQEARRIPHSFKDAPGGGHIVTLHHETDGLVECPKGDTYADASIKAGEYVTANYPGRTL